jgi:hypothetical protein
MAILELKCGGKALVDDADLPLVSQWEWRSNPGGYVCRYENKKVFLLHRVILGAKAREIVDHRDGDGLNNRRSNLRLCTHAQNMRNRKKHSHSQMRFKGVEVDRRKGRESWRARIRVDGRQIRSGRVPDDRTTARLYDLMAEQYHGEFARTNASLGLL